MGKKHKASNSNNNQKAAGENLIITATKGIACLDRKIYVIHEENEEEKEQEDEEIGAFCNDCNHVNKTDGLITWSLGEDFRNFEDLMSYFGQNSIGSSST